MDIKNFIEINNTNSMPPLHIDFEPYKLERKKSNGDIQTGSYYHGLTKN